MATVSWRPCHGDQQAFVARGARDGDSMHTHTFRRTADRNISGIRAMQRKFDDLLLGSIELFCLAAEQGSFTLAANAASVTPAAVSRSVARLEERLGVRLFVRTTRQIRLTDSGQRYFEQCRAALGQLVDAEREATGQQSTPAGVLRISMPTPYGHYRVLPLLPAFRELYPQVQVEAHLSNRNIDFADQGYDLAIRGRAPEDSSLIARKLEDAELAVVASPTYLQRAGVPETVEDLQAHECIQFERPSSGRNIPWTFVDGTGETDIVTHGGYGTSGDVLAGVTLARSGAGLFQTYRFILEEDLREGRLVEVLRDCGRSTRPFILLYPHGRYLSSRVRVFVDFLVERLAHPGRKRA
jgi:DNA-binding transcriptional LysR family regulator